jgi:hypothetical protein
MRALTWGSIAGRPGRPLILYVHFFLTSSRCQRSRVSGLTKNEDHRPLSIARLAAPTRLNLAHESQVLEAEPPDVASRLAAELGATPATEESRS